MSHRGLSLALVLALPLLPARAGVLVVDKLGQGDFTQLQAALNAASDGDILLLKHFPGSFTTSKTVLPDKSLTLVADGQVTLQGLALPVLSAGRTLVLQGLRIDRGLRIANAAGAVRLFDCDTLGEVGIAATWNPWTPGTAGGPSITLVASTDVALTHCELYGGSGGALEEDDFQSSTTPGGPGLQVDASIATVADCTITGGFGGWANDGGESGAAGGVAVVNLSGTVLLLGGTLRGGYGSSGDLDGFGNCGAGGSGGDALHTVEAGALTWLRGVTLLAGEPGVSGCSWGGPASWGQLSVVEDGDTAHFGAEPTGFTVTSPVREQQTVTITLTGEPGDIAFTWLSLQTAYALLPKFQGTLLVDAPLASLALGVVPAEQRLDVLAKVPELGPGLEGVALQMQSFVQRGSGWLLGPPATLVALDASF